MLATVIVDKYRASETGRIEAALEGLCSPEDNYGWSSSGIYCFWDVQSKEVLYVGLAVDLPLRFRQHNGLASCPDASCKRERVAEYFGARLELGYSVMVQSVHSQGICTRWNLSRPEVLAWITEEFGYLDEAETKRVMNREVDATMRRMESAMLQVHMDRRGRLPQWNRIRGVDRGFSEGVLTNARHFLDSLTLSHAGPDPFLARVTLSGLQDCATYQRFEEVLHGGRITVLGRGGSVLEGVESLPGGRTALAQMQAEGYFSRRPRW